MENETLFRNLNQEGELLDRDICDKCKQEFNKNFMSREKIIMFNCKHILHKKCAIQEKSEQDIIEICPICQELEIQNAINKGKSLIKKQSIILDNERYGNKEFQVNVSFTSQNILKKLKKFDNKLKVKKRISIESLSEEL